MPTPTPAIPTFASDIMVTATPLNAVGSNLTNLYNYAMGGFRTLKPFAAVRCTSQSIPANADTALTWDTKDIDNDGMWSSGSNNHLTVQTAGAYWIQMRGVLNTSPGGSNLRVMIAINSTAFSTSGVGGIHIGNGDALNCAALVGLSVGAQIYGGIYQNAPPGSTAYPIGTAAGGCRLTAEWMSS